MHSLDEVIKIDKIYSHPSAIILMLIPVFLIISSNVYSAISSGIQDREVAFIGDTLAQVQVPTNRVHDTSDHHSRIPIPLFSSTSPDVVVPTSITSITGFSESSDKDYTTQAALGSVTARPTNNIVNTNSFYDVAFVTSIGGAIKTIQVTFPAGTTIPSGAFFNEAEKCVPGGNCTILTGSASKSGQTLN